MIYITMKNTEKSIFLKTQYIFLPQKKVLQEIFMQLSKEFLAMKFNLTKQKIKSTKTKNKKIIIPIYITLIIIENVTIFLEKIFIDT